MLPAKMQLRQPDNIVIATKVTTERRAQISGCTGDMDGISHKDLQNKKANNANWKLISGKESGSLF
jgi:hypothetical protein